MSVKIEIGKYYKAENGEVGQCISERDGHFKLRFLGLWHFRAYREPIEIYFHSDGRRACTFYAGFRIVKEVIKINEVKFIDVINP